MKQAGIFIAGMVCGVILFCIIATAITRNGANGSSDVTLFEQEGNTVSTNSFKVFQVIGSEGALAMETRPLGIGSEDLSVSTNLVVFFLNKDGVSYYDDQIIKVPAGKCVKQIGIYKYLTKDEREKTVPIVDIRDR
ncbi:MAG: hypothetical protein K2H16_10485 [Prevotella sp.]|nr:hypothetical protein [Prevotella sp.]MDE6150786.1 hypothetical protein [Prevotella sp.]